MIDPKKTYRTRDGHEVRIYAVDSGGAKPVHGAIRNNELWDFHCWSSLGYWALVSGAETPLDLIEVKPRIKRDVWVNVFEHACSTHETKQQADYFGKCGLNTRIACVKLTIDCEEGEGL
jgi:hypothetical protein